MFGLIIETDRSRQILQRAILNNKEELLLNTPIVLFQLLVSSDSKKLLNYFHNLVADVEMGDERDDSFVELMVNSLFNTTTLSGPQKHNLKVAMHYINGSYYLKKALEKLNG